MNPADGRLLFIDRARGRLLHSVLIGPSECSPTLADVFLVPQVANAQRLKVPMEPYPRIRAIDEACLALPAFDRARPEKQADAE